MSFIGVLPTLTPLVKKFRRSKLTRTLEIEIKTRLGIPVRYHSPARSILENTIIPYFAIQQKEARVLFVGCDWYTKHYEKQFEKSEYWTIDSDPKKKRFGTSRHIITTIELLDRHFQAESLDVIFCNGVLGYGLNNVFQAEQAFDSCYTCLRQGGKLVLGREDDPEFLPFSNDDLHSLRKFNPFVFPPLATSHYSTKPHYNYTFSFFEKPSSELKIEPQPARDP